MKRRIAIVTGARSDYGLLYWVIKGIYDDPELKLLLIVTGMHLSRRFGLTVREIEKEGFPIAERVKIPLSSDAEEGIAESMGIGVKGFAKAYERLKPDILIVLGDRFEILSAVMAAVPFRIPIAHIHGGEATEGLIDEGIRHAITKLSHIHFTSTEKYRKKVIQMGESPGRVFSFGAPGLDSIYKLNLLKREKLSEELGLPGKRSIGVITYHPVTLEKGASTTEIQELLKAVRSFPAIYWVFTMTNADTESSIVIDRIKGFTKEYPEYTKLFMSLGQLRYLSLLKNAAVMVGNSSSGFIEAPSFRLPVVNLGNRQSGRIRAHNIIDITDCRKKNLVGAIKKALSTEFRDSLKGMKNPYGDEGASEKIVKTLKTVSLGEGLVKKRFYEIG